MLLLMPKSEGAVDPRPPISDGPTLLLVGLYIATALLRSRSCLGFVMEDRARAIEAVFVGEATSTKSYGGGGYVKV